jgi:tRNA modification GTPase
LTKLNDIEATTKQGVLLQEGITIVIAGKPNVGKSSLLNLLSGEDRAIVTEIPGTTRDILSSQIQLDGLPLHLLDTAGLRATSDIIEQEGVKRAWNAINKADHLLLLFDASSETTRNPKELLIDFFKQLPETVKCTVVFNKIDLTHEKECITEIGGFNCLFISLKTRSGIELLKDHLKKSVGFSCLNGSIYSARRRHLEALSETKKYLLNATNSSQSKTFEFMAEDLRLAQEKLGEITGKFTTEDLLNKIFSEFCVGK